VNIPGEASSVPTAIEGYPMTKQGRAGVALGMSAIASFMAGTISVIVMMWLAPGLAEFALRFGPPEYFALMMLGMCAVTALSGRYILKGCISAVLGLIIGTTGVDVMTAVHRFCFGQA